MSAPDHALPVDEVLSALRAALAAHPTVLLQAPPGAGKTTRVPLALLAENWLAGQKILILEPRRLAARLACARMAETLGEKLGEQVGYRIRLERRVSPATRIEVLTEGILTRRLQQDPLLEGVGLIIFDEYHERGLHADLALALCRDIQAGLREDLRLLLMSATLDTRALAEFLGQPPVIESEGRAWPVDIRYRPLRDTHIARAASAALPAILEETEGDVLVFLPGGGEIRQCARLLEDKLDPARHAVLPLHGDLPKAQQDRALAPLSGKRKLVLATTVAETSLTIEGIQVVVDSGWTRRPSFDPRSGLSRLETRRVSQAQAVQRAGRAGRLGPGICYRLWPAHEFERLAPRTPPEILNADLAPLRLELALWGEAGALAWPDPPPAGALAQATGLLQRLGALDSAERVTPLGRRMAAWPLHPRLAGLLCRAEDMGRGALGCDLAALLSERDILRGPERRADLGLRLELLRRFRQDGRDAARAGGGDPNACAAVERIAGELRRRLTQRGEEQEPDDQALGLLLAFAYPERLAQCRPEGRERYRLANGRGAALLRDDPLVGQPWLVAAHLDAGQREARIYLAAPVSRQALETHPGIPLQTRERVAWDAENRAVIARREQCLGELVLNAAPLEPIPEAERLAALLAGLRQAGLDALPWTPALRQWQARVMCLRAWQPEAGWPAVDDARLLADLEQWLAPWLVGITRLEHLARLDFAGILQALLDWPRQRELDRLAPTHLQVPSGSRISLDYRPSQPPVLAARLQEMFGLAETPTVADGQVRVMLHLLSPARRPVQVTQDLASFWQRGYQEVKKELKGRYPKHYWPDDPWQATPTRRVRVNFNGK